MCFWGKQVLEAKPMKTKFNLVLFITVPASTELGVFVYSAAPK
jgi:hypothetical protein